MSTNRGIFIQIARIIKAYNFTNLRIFKFPNISIKVMKLLIYITVTR